MPYPTFLAKNPSPTDPTAKPKSIKIRSIELAVAFFSGGTRVNAQAWIIGWSTAKAIPNNTPETRTIHILVEKPNKIKPAAPEMAAGMIRILWPNLSKILPEKERTNTIAIPCAIKNCEILPPTLISLPNGPIKFTVPAIAI